MQGKIVGRVIGGKYIVEPTSGTSVGVQNDAGEMTDKAGKKIGVLVPYGRRVIARDGRIVGSVLPSGRVATDDLKEVGYVTASMRALTDERKFLGRVVSVRDMCKNKDGDAGPVHLDGRIVEGNHAVLGRSVHDG